MNLLLLLFAIPFATVIFSIILQKLIKCPILVALAAFSIFIILAVTVFDETFFILAVIYSILAYVAALLARIIGNIISRYYGNNQIAGACECDEKLMDGNQGIYEGFSGSSQNQEKSSELIIDKCGCRRKGWYR